MGNDVFQISISDAIASLNQANNQWYVVYNVECREILFQFRQNFYFTNKTGLFVK